MVHGTASQLALVAGGEPTVVLPFEPEPFALTLSNGVPLLPEPPVGLAGTQCPERDDALHVPPATKLEPVSESPELVNVSWTTVPVSLATGLATSDGVWLIDRLPDTQSLIPRLKE